MKLIFFGMLLSLAGVSSGLAKSNASAFVELRADDTGSAAQIVADFGIKNKGSKGFYFIASDWVNCSVECVNLKDGTPVKMTKFGKRIRALFNPNFFSRRGVEYVRINRGEKKCLITHMKIEAIFEMTERDEYAIRVIFEDYFPGEYAVKKPSWSGRVESDWVPFSLKKNARMPCGKDDR